MKTPVYIFPEMFNINNVLNFNINKIKFSDISYQKKYSYIDTVKIKHFIDMYYKNNCIIIQLPIEKLHMIKDDIISLEFVNSNFNEYVIKPLEEHICETIHKQSEKWFGKLFTMNKIINSLESPLKKKDNSNSNFILNLSINKNTNFFNRYKSLIKIKDIENYFNLHNTNIICLIKLDNLEFFENKFTYNFILEQAKVFIEERLIEYSIIDSIDYYSDYNEIDSSYNV